VPLDAIAQHFGKPLSYYPQLAKATGGVTAAILLSYLLEKQSCAARASDWFAATEQEINTATGLTREEQEVARQKLRNRGFIQEQLGRGQDGDWEFHLEVEVLARKLAAFSRLIFQDKKATKSPTSVEDSHPKTQQNTQSSTAPRLLNRDNFPPQDEKNKTLKIDPFFQRSRQLISRKISPHYQFSGPWKSPEQFEEFQRSLLAYATQQGWQHSAAWTFKIIDSITKGIISPFWEEFISGKPLGSTQQIQREWEIEPGVPYPAFEESRIQYYVSKGEQIDAAVARARADLRNPVLGKDLWEGFLRKCDRLADEAILAQKRGVKIPYLPPAFAEKKQVRKEEIVQKFEKIRSQPALTESYEKSQNVPAIEMLQKIYNSPLGKTIATSQIARNPEWGYRIVQGEIIKVDWEEADEETE